MNPSVMQEMQVQSLGQEDSPEGGHSNPLQYCSLENPRDGVVWRRCSPWGHKELDLSEGTEHERTM